MCGTQASMHEVSLLETFATFRLDRRMLLYFILEQAVSEDAELPCIKAQLKTMVQFLGGQPACVQGILFV
jgi:hypothetical protein